MQTRIFKYKLDTVGHQTSQIPVGAKFLHTEVQMGIICVWALVNLDVVTHTRNFYVIGTGHPIDENLEKLDHLGTVLTNAGMLVLHVFVDKES